MTDRQLQQAAKILYAILEVPAVERMDVLAIALRVAIDHDLLRQDNDPLELLRRRYPMSGQNEP